MKPVDVRTFKFKFGASSSVRTALFSKIENRVFSWREGYHDIWVALYEAIEE